MDKVCAFFGHREIWDDISAPLEQAIRTAIMQYGVTSFWVGGCGQFDACAAGSVRRLKKEFPHIRLYLILAYLPMKKDPYFCAYDSTIYPEGLEFVPKRFAISKRNRWMVENCDLVIACINRSHGGAYQAYKTAKGKKVVLNLGSLGKRGAE